MTPPHIEEAEIYDPVECLREEVKRFKATNQFTPMLVTNFYAQASVVLGVVDQLRAELPALLAARHNLQMRVNEKVIECENLHSDNDTLRASLTELQQRFDAVYTQGKREEESRIALHGQVEGLRVENAALRSDTQVLVETIKSLRDERVALKAELALTQTQRSEVTDRLCEQASTLGQKLSKLEQENDALRGDKARVDFLDGKSVTITYFDGVQESGSIRDAIDAKRKKEL